MSAYFDNNYAHLMAIQRWHWMCFYETNNIFTIEMRCACRKLYIVSTVLGVAKRIYQLMQLLHRRSRTCIDI
jgi:hypothetical protein